MADYSELISEYCVYAVDPPCDCDYEEIFGVDHPRSDELWSAVPVEDAQEMIQEAVTAEFQNLLDDLKVTHDVLSKSQHRSTFLNGQKQQVASMMAMLRNRMEGNK